MKWRAGTRGSDLAVWQTRSVAGLLRAVVDVEIEEVVIETHAERRPHDALSADVWPSGGFVREIEQALLDGRIDFAVHSYKDLPTMSPEGLVVAAVPPRGPMHDRLVARDARTATRFLTHLSGRPPSSGDRPLRIGTSSPRRAEQLHRAFRCEIVGVRGNLPTRLHKLDEEGLDAICLAAAGLDRLGLGSRHAIDLPIARFPTAPAQGAIAVQTRRGTNVERLARQIDHGATSRAIAAERSFLATIDAGCQTPLAATASVEPGSARVRLHAQLFGPGATCFDARDEDDDPLELGRRLALRALSEVRRR